MNTILSEQGRVKEESEVLKELVELAAIMQEEAEALVEMVDLVEEYIEEIDTAMGVEELVQNLESVVSPSVPIRTMHEREDSGISMGDETDSTLGTSEKQSKKVPQGAILPRRRKERKKKEPQFHDSALDLLSPVGRRPSPRSPRSPRWI
jgi:hypothetical protein